jgi:hypothetical protein
MTGLVGCSLIPWTDCCFQNLHWQIVEACCAFRSEKGGRYIPDISEPAVDSTADDDRDPSRTVVGGKRVWLDEGQDVEVTVVFFLVGRESGCVRLYGGVVIPNSGGEEHFVEKERSDEKEGGGRGTKRRGSRCPSIRVWLRDADVDAGFGGDPFREARWFDAARKERDVGRDTS